LREGGHVGLAANVGQVGIEDGEVGGEHGGG
jgi:hypothetical protein